MSRFDCALVVESVLMFMSHCLCDDCVVLSRFSIFHNDSTPITQTSTTLHTQLQSTQQSLKLLHSLVSARSRTESREQFETQHTHRTVITSNLQTEYAELYRQFQALLQQFMSNLRYQQTRAQYYSTNHFLPRRDHRTPIDQSYDNGAICIEEEQTPTYQQHLQLTEQTLQQFQTNTQEVKQIELLLHHISTIFSALSSHVTHQEETIIRIDADMSRSVYHIEKGESELQRYYNSIQSNRMLIIKGFLMLIGFALFWMMIMKKIVRDE